MAPGFVSPRLARVMDTLAISATIACGAVPAQGGANERVTQALVADRLTLGDVHGELRGAVTGRQGLARGSASDTDLFADEGFRPTSSAATRRSERCDSNESCAIARGGTYYVGIFGFENNPAYT